MKRNYVRGCLLIVLLLGVDACGETRRPDRHAMDAREGMGCTPAANELRGLGVDVAALGRVERKRGTAQTDAVEMTAARLYHLLVEAGADAGFDSDTSRAGGGKSADGSANRREQPTDGTLRIRLLGGPEASKGGALETAIRRAFEEFGVDSPDFLPADELSELSPATQPAADNGIEVAFHLAWKGASEDSPETLARTRRYAQALYAGIKDFADEHREHAGTDDAQSTTHFSDAAERPRAGKLTPEVTRRLDALARELWSDAPLPDDRVDWFCALVTRLGVTNRSLVYSRIGATQEDDRVVLHGATNAPSLVTGLEYALKQVGVERVDNRVRILPDRDKLGERLYGVCRVSHAISYVRPDTDAVEQTELLYGEPVYVLDQGEGWMLVHAMDGYWGWVKSDAIRPITKGEFHRYSSLPQGVVIEDIARAKPVIPRGARLLVVSHDEKAVTVLLADGSQCDLPSDSFALDETDRTRAAERIEAALSYLGQPYVFGGRSPVGIDCSGLITAASAQTLGSMPRDAWHQAFSGRVVATWWDREGMRPGDYVYFIDPTGKIYHTGVALSATHIVHAAPPFVRVGSLRAEDPLFDGRCDRDFFMAKRP